MLSYCLIVSLFIIFTETSTEIDQVRELVKRWAPLVWLHKDERYFPLSVDKFLENVHLEDDKGELKREFLSVLPTVETKRTFLVTNRNLEELKFNTSFLNGLQPSKYPIPVYAVVKFCHAKKPKTNLHFRVTYWTFYPYNKGKNICFLGKVPSPLLFGRCLGHLKTIGNHIGDWEQVTLTFHSKQAPTHMFLSVHNTGTYYKYDPINKNFKFDLKNSRNKRFSAKSPPTGLLQNGHPVVFSADGSHGLWSAPGDYQYANLPRLFDRCSYGNPWKTWENLQIYVMGVDILPAWMFYRGKWGNSKSKCVLFKRLGVCEYTDGPDGILRDDKQYQC